MKTCKICKTQLQEGNQNNIYGTSEGMNHISNHHLFPKRFLKYFTIDEIQQTFEIPDPSIEREFCYECHEEILHNIIINDSMISDLSIFFEGCDKKSRMKIFHEIFKEGLEIYKKKYG